MAANGSSANTANIITALGNAFKDPSGAALPNDRLAAVLIQNMNQLNDLAKQGKLNQQQIMQVRPAIPCSITSISLIDLFLERLATGLCRQAQARDDKAGAWTQGTRSPHPISSSLRASLRQTTPLFLSRAPPLARAHPAPRVRALGAEDDDGQLDRDAERERDLEGRLPDQHDAHPDQHGARRVAVRRGGAADAHGRHDRGAHSRCVASPVSCEACRTCWLTTAVWCVLVLVLVLVKRHAVGAEEPERGDGGDGRDDLAAQVDAWRCEHAPVDPGPRRQHRPEHQDRTRG